MGRSCDFGICAVDATRVATFSAERGETKNKWACSLQHELGVGREIRSAGWNPSWRLLKADAEPLGAAAPAAEPEQNT